MGLSFLRHSPSSPGSLFIFSAPLNTLAWGIKGPVEVFSCFQSSTFLSRGVSASAGATPPTWESQPQVLRWPQGPLMSSLPTSFPTALSDPGSSVVLLVLLPDVAVIGNHYICHSNLCSLFVHHQMFWLVHNHLLFILYLDVPQDLSMVVVYHFWRCVPQIQSKLGTDLPYRIVATWSWGST